MVQRLWTSLVVPPVSETENHLGRCHFIPRYMPKRKENSPQRSLYTRVYSIIIPNNWKVKIIPMSINNGYTAQLWHVKRSEAPTDTRYNLGEPWKHAASERSRSLKVACRGSPMIWPSRTGQPTRKENRWGEGLGNDHFLGAEFWNQRPWLRAVDVLDATKQHASKGFITCRVSVTSILKKRILSKLKSEEQKSQLRHFIR